MTPTLQSALVDVPDSTISRYLEAHRAVEERFGLSPGPEFLMALAISAEDPMQLVDDFCAEIVASLRNQNH